MKKNEKKTKTMIPSSTSDKTSEASQSDASEEHSSDDSTGISDEDDTDHSSVHGSLPPLLSRREAEFFAFDDDEDRGHVTDGDYEV
ncbi:hypothetical protein MRX96_026564 [Rhipicephalus microplus]